MTVLRNENRKASKVHRTLRNREKKGCMSR